VSCGNTRTIAKKWAAGIKRKKTTSWGILIISHRPCPLSHRQKSHAGFLFENCDFTNCKLPIRKGRLEKGILGRTVLFLLHEPSLHPYTPATSLPIGPSQLWASQRLSSRTRNAECLRSALQVVQDDSWEIRSPSRQRQGSPLPGPQWFCPTIATSLSLSCGRASGFRPPGRLRNFT